MNYLIDEEIIYFLKKLYPNKTIELIKVPYKGLISVFFVTVNSSDELSESWSDISNSIASYYQSELESDFERWNIYIIFMSMVPILLGLKYKIENDRFSSRKIVADNVNTDINSVEMKSLITSNITNNDIVIPEKPVGFKDKKYQGASPIWETIRDANLKRGKGSAIEINLFLDHLVEKLEDENKKG